MGINPERFSDFKEYLRVSQEISFMGGEPLVTARKQIMEIALSHPDKTLFLNTNGILLDTMDFERFLHKFSTIVISLNSANRRTHEYINKGSDWDRVMSNTKWLLNIKKGRKLNRPNIVINMVILDSNYTEIPDFIELGQELGCDVNFDLCRGIGYRKTDMVIDLPEGRARDDLLEIVEKIIKRNPNKSYGLEIVRRYINRNKSKEFSGRRLGLS